MDLNRAIQTGEFVREAGIPTGGAPNQYVPPQGYHVVDVL